MSADYTVVHSRDFPMETSMRVKLLICLFTLMTAACTDETGDRPVSGGQSEAVVFEAGPRLSQCSGISITRTQSAAKLTAAGVEVRRSSCGTDGMLYPTVCGAGTDNILLHDIPAASVAAAQAAGFGLVDSLQHWRRSECPQYLHAIEVAQGSTDCAQTRNRVIAIEEAARPDDRFVLLDQAGTCADASYRQLLFGDDGDDLLCSNADSIAGPRKSCAVRARAAMFDIILANLDRPDLGLGSAYYVSQVYPAN
jgi:hypothetical protein